MAPCPAHGGLPVPSSLMVLVSDRGMCGHQEREMSFLRASEVTFHTADAKLEFPGRLGAVGTCWAGTLHDAGLAVSRHVWVQGCWAGNKKRIQEEMALVSLRNHGLQCLGQGSSGGYRTPKSFACGRVPDAMTGDLARGLSVPMDLRYQGGGGPPGGGCAPPGEHPVSRCHGVHRKAQPWKSP